SCAPRTGRGSPAAAARPPRAAARCPCGRACAARPPGQSHGVLRLVVPPFDRRDPEARRPCRHRMPPRARSEPLELGQVNRDQIEEVMESFAPDQLPAINQLAREFCLCDHWFCEVPGPTMPNRMYIHAATSEGYVHNAFQRDFTSKTIYELVQEQGLTWCTYCHDLNEVLQFKNLGESADHFRRFEDRWESDVSQGALPNYVFILPRFNN